MRRTVIEARLRELGWTTAGPSGRNHTRWVKPGHLAILLRNSELIWDSSGEAILLAAGRDSP